jgi:hypothetical protein
MTVINRGRSGRWHIFRGNEAPDFLAGLTVTGQWPVKILLPGHGLMLARLFATAAGTFALCTNGDNVPVRIMQQAFHSATRQAREEFRRKHAAN